MLIPIQEIIQKYNPKFTGVIHVGGHYGEEFMDYRNSGIIDQVWIEPCENAFKIMQENIGNKNGVRLFNCACGEERGVSLMYVAPSNDGQSNSMLEPHLHLEQHPSVVFTERELVQVIPLEELPIKIQKYNFLAMDVQGAEGLVLLGARKLLPFIDYIYTEVNRDSVYKGNWLIEQVDEFLSNFQRVETKWVGNWGDAFYIRKTLQLK